MKNKSNRGYAAKHDVGTQLDADLAVELENVKGEEGVSCENAHAIAHRLQKSPRETGTALDLLNLRIARCQLGLFGYAPPQENRQARPECRYRPGHNHPFRLG